MRGFLRKTLTRRATYTRLIDVTISRAAILHNLHIFQGKYGLGVTPVLKSNAYGHGLVEVANILDGEQLPFLCVDSFFEALTLRNEGMRTPILLIGYTPLETIRNNKLRRISFTILSLAELKRLAAAGVQAAIHLKFDTGMHRHGLLPGELDAALAIIKENPQLRLEGALSHLADADTEHSAHAAAQIETWNALATRIKSAVPEIKYLHCGQTAGSFYSARTDANVMRLGIGLYGINSGLDTLDLKLALEMHTRITSLRTLEAGEHIGYNGTFETRGPTVIASIPGGYTEGIDRRLSNQGVLTVKGVACPIVGRVSMNITSLDVSVVPGGVALDDPVLVISAERNAPNSFENMAKLCGTIPYELMVHLPAGVHRRYL